MNGKLLTRAGREGGGVVKKKKKATTTKITVMYRTIIMIYHSKQQKKAVEIIVEIILRWRVFIRRYRNPTEESRGEGVGEGVILIKKKYRTSNGFIIIEYIENINIYIFFLKMARSWNLKKKLIKKDIPTVYGKKYARWSIWTRGRGVLRVWTTPDL